MWGEDWPAAHGRAPHGAYLAGTRRPRAPHQRGCQSRGARPCPRGAAWQAHRQSASSVAWECSVKSGGGLLPRLNTRLRPISHKYREGKVKRTLKRESKRARNHGDGNLCTLHKRKPRGVVPRGASWDTGAPWGELDTARPRARRLGGPPPGGRARGRVQPEYGGRVEHRVLRQGGSTAAGVQTPSRRPCLAAPPFPCAPAPAGGGGMSPHGLHAECGSLATGKVPAGVCARLPLGAAGRAQHPGRPNMAGPNKSRSARGLVEGAPRPPGEPRKGSGGRGRRRGIVEPAAQRHTPPVGARRAGGGRPGRHATSRSGPQGAQAARRGSPAVFGALARRSAGP